MNVGNGRDPSWPRSDRSLHETQLFLKRKGPVFAGPFWVVSLLLGTVLLAN